MSHTQWFSLRPSFEWIRCFSLNRNLTHLSFDNLVSTKSSVIFRPGTSGSKEPNMLTSKNRLQLDELAQHKRFKNCKLSHFINDIDPELQKQFFAAMTSPLTSRHLSDCLSWGGQHHWLEGRFPPDLYEGNSCSKARPSLFKELFAFHHPKQKVILAGHSKEEI